VGNDLTRGIVDNHSDDGLKKSAFRLLRENPGVWSYLFGVKKINVIVHESPDFDCIASAFYLMTCLINGKSYNHIKNELDYSKELNILDQYCTLNDNGSLLYDRNLLKNVIEKIFYKIKEG
jgi:hypothetical protein